MTLRLHIHPAVYGVDLRQAVAYYRELNAELPEQISAEFDDRLDAIEEHPKAGRMSLRGYRRVVLRHFPYLVVYTVDEQEINVLAVVHGRRDPHVIRALISIRR